MIVLDASVLIAHFDATDSHHDRAGELLLRAADQEQPLAASPITLAEVLVGPARTGRLDQATAALDQLRVQIAAFSSPPIRPAMRWRPSMTASRTRPATTASPCGDANRIECPCAMDRG